MCNHYRSDGAWRDQMGEFSELRLPLFDRSAPRPNVQGPDIWPGYTGEVLAIDDGVLVAQAATWLYVPFWYRKSVKAWRRSNGGCNNARGETAATSGIFRRAGRCVIPGDAFFEYAREEEENPYRRKREFRFSPIDGRPLFFAGLSSRAEPEEGPMFTYAMVTTAPGPDVQSIGHHRQPVILKPETLADWLEGAPIGGFMESSPAGTFKVDPAVRAPS